MRMFLLAAGLFATVLVTLGAAVAPTSDGVVTTTDADDRVTPPVRGPPAFAAVTVDPSFRGGEPNVAVGPDGRVYVAALGGPSGVWRSDDGGATFARVSSIPGQNGDSDIALDDDGTVYVSDLFPDVPVSVSLDHGATYVRTTSAVPEGFPDRQWMVADGSGDVYVTWKGAGGTRFSASHDAAQTWSVHGALAVIGTSISGPLVLGPDGSLNMAVSVGDERLDLVRSHDRGATWSRTTVVSGGTGSHVDGSFPVVALDDAGTVYVAWSERVGARYAGVAPRVMLAVSTDGGATFGDPTPVSDEGRLGIFPWLVAGAEGRIALFWLDGVPPAGVAGDPGAAPGTQWFLRVAQSLDAHRPAPTFTTALVTSDMVHTGSACAPCYVKTSLGSVPGVALDRRMLDFFEAAVDLDGNVVVTWTQDPPLEERADAHLVSVHFARQVAGPRLR